jgi:DNA-directed RNA polymerase subunit RPC12/RpoP
MSQLTYFVQECPTCGRTLHVRVDYLGKNVICQHCGGRFLASDTEPPQPSLTDSGLALLRRAQELLDRADQKRQTPK